MNKSDYLISVTYKTQKKCQNVGFLVGLDGKSNVYNWVVDAIPVPFTTTVKESFSTMNCFTPNT